LEAKAATPRLCPGIRRRLQAMYFTISGTEQK
jgi:hypothetical protein